MSVLHRHMYLSPNNSRLFGLANQQERTDRSTRSNLGWFNRQGSYLGQGDLDNGDILRIADELPMGEVFATLPPGYYLEGDDTLPLTLVAHSNFLIVKDRPMRRGDEVAKRGFGIWEVTADVFRAILMGSLEAINDPAYFRARPH